MCCLLIYFTVVYKTEHRGINFVFISICVENIAQLRQLSRKYNKGIHLENKKDPAFLNTKGVDK